MQHEWPDGHGAVTDLLEDCEIVLGVPAEPPMTIGDERWAVVLEVARAVDGVVFDGFAYYAPDGSSAT